MLPPDVHAGMTRRARRARGPEHFIVTGCPMSGRSAVIACTLVALSVGGARAQAPAPSETAKGMVGGWEISNAARDKTCLLTLKLDPAGAGFRLELDSGCGAAFPSLKDLTVWTLAPNDAVRLHDSKGAVILDFAEVESHVFEAERKGEGLYFMRTQDAVKAATISPEQLFGEWTLLKEFEKPLCKLTLSNASAGGESYKLTVKPGCDASVAGLGLTTWRLERDELLLVGRSGSWRFSESDATSWERIPPSADPLVLMRQ